MKAKDFIIIAVVLGVAAFLYFIDQEKKDAEKKQYVDSIFFDTKKIMLIDSIEDQVTARILDSVNTILLKYDEKLKILENQSRQIRIKNNELEKKYNSITIDRPEF